MASDDKKIKADPAPKSEAAAKNKSASGEASKADPAPKTEAAAKNKSAPGEAAKAESGEPAASAPSNYSRGEGQKPVTAAYKENWNAIFVKKNARKSAKKKKR